MPALKCGSRVWDAQVLDHWGSIGCLVTADDSPGKLFAVTASHVVAIDGRGKGTAVAAAPADADQTTKGSFLGLVDRATGLLPAGPNTLDAALIWVDPDLVAADIAEVGAITHVNHDPEDGITVTMFGAGSNAEVPSTIAGTIDSIAVPGPDGSPYTYTDQIICPLFTKDGDSGAAVVDDQGRLVGFVVGWTGEPRAGMGDGQGNVTVVCPAAALFDLWNLTLVTDIPGGLSKPPAPSKAPADPAATTAVDYGSLVPGGFFSADPFDTTVRRSIRTNNPGAINDVPWQRARPGYVGKTSPDASADHNVTAIYRTPEHGVASWYHLIARIYGFGAGGLTVNALAAHYAGANAPAAAVAAYVNGWVGLSAGALTADGALSVADDDQMLTLARAMFHHEAGVVSPLHDDQIVFAITAERAGNLPA